MNHLNFWSKVSKTPDCWLWTGYKIRGYGQTWDGKKKVLAHRFGYELFQGKIPKGLVLDHLCKNPACVRWDHLEPVTDAINNLRSNSPSAINSRKTHCPYGHSNWRKNHNGSRTCIDCKRAWDRKYQSRRPPRRKVALSGGSHE